MTRRLESVFSLLKKTQLGLISSCHRFEYNVQVMFHRTSPRNRVYRLTITSSYVSLSFGLVDYITLGDSIVIGKKSRKNTKVCVFSFYQLKQH